MKLCGETLFFLNAAIDTGLLVCSARLCGEQLRWRRMILAGFLGGVYAVVALLPGFAFLRHGLVKASMAAAICLVAFGASARYFRLTAVYCAMGCLFAGLVLAFTQLMGTGLLQLPGGGFYPGQCAGTFVHRGALPGDCAAAVCGKLAARRVFV